MRSLFPEAWLRRVWYLPHLLGEPLRTVDGRNLRVLSPGTSNPGDGPDFLGATILLDDTPLRGDVEFHFDSADWFAHRHHHDERYHNVVLHVVLNHSLSGFGVRRQNGEWIPTVELRSHLRLSLGKFFRILATSPIETICPLPPDVPPSHKRTSLLDDLSETRLLRKAERFAERASLIGEEAAFYEALADALGYTANRLPFAKLVERVPLSALLERETKEREAYLLGTAGLLPSQRGIDDPHPYVAELETQWHATRKPTKIMSPADWHESPTRVPNHPVRRVVALARLTGTLSGRFLEVLAPLLETGGWRKRWETLEIRDTEYWADHGDFGLRLNRRMERLVGTRRARDMWVNVVLPAFLVRGEFSRERIVALYRSHPPLQANTKTTWIERHVLFSERLLTARRQQGALELYDFYCNPRRCHECPLNRKESL